MPPAVGDLIDPQGPDRAQDSSLQSPFDDPLDRAVDVVSGGAELPGDLEPREFARPARQKLHVGVGQLMLTLGPGQELGDNAAAPALHATSGVAKEHREAPERNKRKGALRQAIR